MTASAFKQSVQESLQDPLLQLNYRRVTGNLVRNRSVAVSQIPEFEALRERVHRYRLNALQRLPELLQQLEKNCTANGIRVHWAENGTDCNRVVSGILRDKNVRLILKGKSMVTEETHLNTHLEKEGYRVLETDLGEYIIQLINEAPSHIVAPAMHKNFEQIRDIILGADYPDKDNVNEQMLTKIVRERMREDYKRADAGITGVNFAAADTGTLCLVENEGNGRYSSTVPRIHIAVMGLEKTIASFRQLPDLLQALTVSATGQKISTYVNMISSPRRPGEADGPDEVHLVILDNGRSDMLADPDLMKTLLCIRCGACMNHCPVYKHIGGHAYGTTIPGPIGKILMPQLLGLETAGHLAGASSLCGACGEVCPVKIPIPDILIRLRAKALQQRSRRHPVSSRFSGEAAAWKMWAMLNSSPRLYRIFRRMLGYMQGLPLARFPIIKEWCRYRAVPNISRQTLCDYIFDPSAEI